LTREYQENKGFCRRLFPCRSQSEEMKSLDNFFAKQTRAQASWQDVERQILDIFVKDLNEGKNPFSWKRLSNRMLWLFLMEAHFQIEKWDSGQHTPLNNPQEIELFELIRPRPVGGMMTGNAPALSGQLSSDQLKIQQAAQVFHQLRPQVDGSLEAFLHELSRKISHWEHHGKQTPWWDLSRKIFGITGVKQVLKQLKNKEATPFEMLSHIQQILSIRLQKVKRLDSNHLYQELSQEIQQRAKIDATGAFCGA
jgi:hypothetical protein